MIEGFTDLQRELADRLWGLDTEEQVQGFIATLPKNLKREAWVVLTMIVASELDGIDLVSPDLQHYLRTL